MLLRRVESLRGEGAILPGGGARFDSHPKKAIKLGTSLDAERMGGQTEGSSQRREDAETREVVESENN